MDKEYIATLQRCGQRVNTLKLALELCATRKELEDTLVEMGFKCYEYVADTVYVDGDKQHQLAGVVKGFKQWARVDESLGMQDTIDTEMGAIKTTCYNYKWCNATELVSIRTMKLLA